MASMWSNSILKPAARIATRSTGVRESGRAFRTTIIPRTRPYQQHFQQRRNYAQVVVQNQARGRTRRILTTVTIGLGMFGLGGYLALSFAPPFITSMILGRIPSDEESLKFKAPDAWTQSIDDHIMTCELAKDLRFTGEFKESRPHQKYPKEIKQHNLTASTLATKDTVPVPPLYFMKKDGSEMYAIYYVGTHVSGHPGVVHGGFLATMLDEGLATCAFASLPNHVGVTAQLDITYKRPTAASQYLVLKATTTQAEGRKVWTNGFIQNLDEFTRSKTGAVATNLVEAKALFIEPRHAKVSKLALQITFADLSSISRACIDKLLEKAD